MLTTSTSHTSLYRAAMLTLFAFACTDTKPEPPPAARAVVTPVPTGAASAVVKPDSLPPASVVVDSGWATVANEDSAANESAPAPVSTPAGSPRPTAALCPAEYAKEAVALRCANGNAYRHGDTLFVRLTDGRLSRYVQSPGREFSKYFEYSGVLRGSGGARTFHLITESNGEWQEIFAVDAMSGDTTTILVPPLMSPDSTRFLISVADENFCASPQNLSIWRITTGKPEQEWVSPKACRTAEIWSIKSGTWTSADTLALTRLVYLEKSGWTPKPARIVRRAGTWSLEVYR